MGRVAVRADIAAGLAGALGLAVAGWLMASAPAVAGATGVCPWVDDIHRAHGLTEHQLGLRGGTHPGPHTAPTGPAGARVGVGMPDRWWRVPGLDVVPGSGLRL